MENYFQAEAYNLDKVLDDFEQNEDEAISPTLLDAKWNQILDPPSHRLSFNPALANVNESTVPNDCPQKLKALSLSHLATGSRGGGDHCSNGSNLNMSQEIPNMWIDDQTTTEDQLIKRNGNQSAHCNVMDEGERKCGTCLPEEKNVVVVAVMHNCDKKTLQSDSLDCKNHNNPSIMDTISFTLDSETQEADHLDVTVNGSTEKDTDTEKEVVQTSRLNTEDDSVKQCTAAASDCLSSGYSSSLLKEKDNTNKDSHFAETTAPGTTVFPLQRPLDPSIKMQESCTSGEGFDIDVAVQRTEPQPRNCSPSSRNGDLSAEAEQTAQQCQSGIPELSGTCQLNAFGSGNHCEHSSRHLDSWDASALENEADKAEKILCTTELLPKTVCLSESQEMVNGELTEQNEMSNKQVQGENEEQLHTAKHEEACSNNGDGSENMMEAGFDLKETSVDELEYPSHTDGIGTSVSRDLPNCCHSYGIQNPILAHIPKTLPSKEDSVTEEKEIEESKSECYSNVYEQRGNEATDRSGLILNCTGDQMKKKYLHNFCSQVPTELSQASPKTAANLQPLSVPFGGARPKQPTNLKLQIPKPLMDHIQNDLVPPNCGGNSKNKNDISGKSKVSENLSANVFSDETSLNATVADIVGEHSDEYESGVSSSSCLAATSDSPDNDLGAGQFGVPTRKPFTTLGEVAPVWVPDSQAPNCMKCEARFTFTKRRHHCRACGKVFCAACCSLKCKLLYMDRKEARVCVICHSVLLNVARPENKDVVWFADGILPNDYAVEEKPSHISVMQQLEDGGPDPLVFVLNANLLSMVKIVNYVNRKCWCFTTKGMHAVGQSEIVILLQCLPDEKCLPKDIFNHFVQLYRDALAGNVVSNLGHSFFSQSFLSSKEHGGFLYVTPAYQSLQDLVLPTPPYLFGILIQKWETPWAKVFPIRLMLRLGAEYRLYPCPLFSVRFRKPLFGETGHTIMNLLADFRNYQYTLPVVQGLVVDMEVRKTSIKIPSNRYNEMMKAMNKSNEHVLAGGACFNERADSHLVCVQNDDGNYQTQAISIHNQPRKVTGASFFVFSGALKSSSGYLAKSSIVEDGVMVQITAENMDSLRQALREMKDFTIACGKIDAEEPQEHVYIQWVDDDKNFNKGVVSPIDGKSMESITSVKIFHGSEYKANGKVVRWTEVFFLENDDQHNGLSDPADHSRLTENVAKAFCLALCPHLKLLKEDGMTKLGLRVTLDADQVGYQAGSNGQPLPAQYMNDLDSALVPVIHGGACQLSEGPVIMELIFYILENIS
ncbi:zinc finger FYVE domain-containing protein 9 [Sceloporus undulatus]|uniref:zinc finger FYVE domain-containing protein 9 n=1 Tax=Sceloporus undulatus TaxID=8520 RepID=UPI001C4DAF65|nr:zinc finger FYVE domain-containing protein 9 [Sceloporus undulatus]